MTNITEASTFTTAVQSVDITDPVLGGVTGESNAAAIALANRTRFLYDHLQRFEEVAVLAASTAIDTTFVHKLIVCQITANQIFTIAAASTFTIGERLVFTCKCASVKNAKLVPTGSDVFLDGSVSKTEFYLYDGEEITLVKTAATQWSLLYGKGNFDKVGQDAFVRTAKPNMVIANGNTPEAGGTLLSRADYARLWAEVQADAVSDAVWLGAPDNNFRSRFSTGDGTSTFRVPDMRAMFMRGLDMGRGISIARAGSTSGDYEGDDNLSHTHSWDTDGSNDSLGGSGWVASSNGASGGNAGSLHSRNQLSGGTEARPKNAGFIPVIYF